MRSSFCTENLFAVKEGFADNTQVLSKSLTKNAEKLSSKNHFGLLLYSPYLSTNGTSLLRGEVTVVTKRAAADNYDSPNFSYCL